MDRLEVIVFLVLTGVLACNCQDGRPGASACPEDFWDGPTKACLKIMDSVLDELVQGEWQVADVRINKTCRAYDSMSSCMDTLLTTCAEDKVAVDDLRKVVDRYKPYSLPCHDEQLRYRQRLVDCFHKKIPNTRKCVKQFDKNFQTHILDDDFDSACKDVQTVMRCFHGTKSEIREICQDEGAVEFEMDYIMPIVEPTRNTVVNKCPALPSPYREYYRMPPSSGAETIFAHVVMVFMVVLVKFS